MKLLKEWRGLEMTERQRLEANENKLRLLSERGWICEVCGKPLSLCIAQLAHRIPKTKFYLKKYGKDVMHHSFNLACVCSLRCNSQVLCDPATRPVEAERLLNEIYEDLKK